MKKEKIFAYALENAVLHGGKAMPNAVLGKLFQDGLKKDDIKSVMSLIHDAVKKVNSMDAEGQKTEYQKLFDLTIKHEHREREGLPEIDVDGKPVFRVCPFPSGPLHIGNARQVILNAEYAKKYRGKFILIFDDTIGSEEKQIDNDAYKLIIDGMKYLEINPDEIFYKSDRLDIYYEHAIALIKKGMAYVCKCSADLLRKNRKSGKECSCRKNSVSENMELWKEMLEKGREGESTLRIKTDMRHPNPAFRDRVIFRICERKHPRTKLKYKVWPLLDFSMAIDDHLLGITNIIRGKELMIEGEVEKYIWNIFGWKAPRIIYTGLLEIRGIKLSKSKSAHEVRTKKYVGWDDPRTFSLQSLEKRGIQPDALRNFIIKLGINANEITVPIESLYDENKKTIESSNRYFFVQNPAKIKIKNAPKIKAELPLHPSENRGFRVISTGDEFYIAKDDYEIIKKGKNQNFRLMNLFNFKNNEFISQEKDMSLHTIPMHWLPVQKNLVKAKVLMPDGKYIRGLAENETENLKTGNIIQFERFGFCRLVKKDIEYEFWFTHK